jgi:Flp pilus assembly protein TadD
VISEPGPFPESDKEGIGVRRHYALAGVAIAIAVAAVIVVAGTRSSETSTATGETPLGRQSLPPGHPQIGPSQTPGPTQTDPTPALAALRGKHTRHPDDVATAIALGDAYLISGQTDKAMHVYGQVLARDPGNATARVKLAMAWHAKGNDAQAMSLIKGVLAKVPRDQLARYDLAIVYFALQKTDEAKAEWQQAAEIDPDSALGKSARNFVDLMDGKTPAPSSGD